MKLNKKTILIVVFSVLNFVVAFSLEKDTSTILYNKNIFFVELAGNGGVYSINYERIFHKKQNWIISSKIGLSYYPQNHNATYLPLSLQFYYGNKSKLEFGIGYTAIFRWDKIKEEGSIFNYDKSKYTLNGKKNYIQGHDEPYGDWVYLNLGLHQEISRKYFLKFEFSPWISKSKTSIVLIPWGKIAFGKTF